MSPSVRLALIICSSRAKLMLPPLEVHEYADSIMPLSRHAAECGADVLSRTLTSQPLIPEDPRAYWDEGEYDPGIFQLARVVQWFPLHQTFNQAPLAIRHFKLRLCMTVARWLHSRVANPPGAEDVDEEDEDDDAYYPWLY